MADERVNILVEAENASKAASDLDKIDNALDDIDDSGKRASGSMSAVGTAIGTFAGGAALNLAGGAKDFAVDFAQDSFDAAQQQEAAAGVWNIATDKFGINAESARARIKALSKDTLSDTQIMLMGAQALELGAASSLEELENLYKIAQSRQGLTGGTIEKAFGDVVTGVGRQSLMILDNLGISTAAMSEGMEDYAASVGSTVKELDDVAKKQAFLHAVQTVALPTQEEFASSFGDMETAAAQYGAAMDDAKAAFGELFGPTAARLLSGAAEAMNDFLLASDPGSNLDSQLVDVEENMAAIKASIDEVNEQGGLLGAVSRNVGGGLASLEADLAAAEALRDEIATGIAERDAMLQETTEPELTNVPSLQYPGMEEMPTVAPPPLDEEAIANEALVAAQTIAEGMTAELEDAGIADDIVSVIEDGMAEQEERLLAVGSDNADTYMDGFMANIANLPQAIIDAIAEQVAPAVGALATDGGRTGAE